MKKIISISILFWVAAIAGFAQNPVWSLPENYLTGGTSQPLPTGDYTGAPAQYAHNAMHDAQGNLLFFVVDGAVRA
jgi:hypothetical protein